MHNDSQNDHHYICLRALQIYQETFDYAYGTVFNEYLSVSDHSGGECYAETYQTKFAPANEPFFHNHHAPPHQEPHHPQPEYHHYPESAFNYHQHHELELAVDSLDLKGP